MALHHRNGGLVIKKVVEYSLNGIVDLILSIFAPPPKQSGCTTKKNEKGGRQSPSERMSIRAEMTARLPVAAMWYIFTK